MFRLCTSNSSVAVKSASSAKKQPSPDSMRKTEPNRTETEGIFRRGGSKRQINNIKADINRNPTLNLEEALPDGSSSDVLIVADLLKEFLREIPGRLVSKEETFALYEEYHTWRHNPLPTNPVESNCVDEYLPFRQIFSRLSRLRQDIIACITRFLAEMATFHVATKMSIDNLATVIGPNIFYSSPRPDNLASSIQEMETSSVLTRFLIQHHKHIFPLPFPEEGQMEVSATHTSSRYPVPAAIPLPGSEGLPRESMRDIQAFNDGTITDGRAPSLVQGGLVSSTSIKSNTKAESCYSTGDVPTRQLLNQQSDENLHTSLESTAVIPSAEGLLEDTKGYDENSDNHTRIFGSLEEDDDHDAIHVAAQLQSLVGSTGNQLSSEINKHQGKQNPSTAASNVIFHRNRYDSVNFDSDSAYLNHGIRPQQSRTKHFLISDRMKEIVSDVNADPAQGSLPNSIHTPPPALTVESSAIFPDNQPENVRMQYLLCAPTLSLSLESIATAPGNLGSLSKMNNSQSSPSTSSLVASPSGFKSSTPPSLFSSTGSHSSSTSLALQRTKHVISSTITRILFGSGFSEDFLAYVPKLEEITESSRFSKNKLLDATRLIGEGYSLVDTVSTKLPSHSANQAKGRLDKPRADKQQNNLSTYSNLYHPPAMLSSVNEPSLFLSNLSHPQEIKNYQQNSELSVLLPRDVDLRVNLSTSEQATITTACKAGKRVTWDVSSVTKGQRKQLHVAESLDILTPLTSDAGSMAAVPETKQHNTNREDLCSAEDAAAYKLHSRETSTSKTNPKDLASHPTTSDSIAKLKNNSYDLLDDTATDATVTAFRHKILTANMNVDMNSLIASPLPVSRNLSRKNIAFLILCCKLLSKHVRNFDAEFSTVHGRAPHRDERQPVIHHLRLYRHLKAWLQDEQLLQKNASGKHDTPLSGTNEEKMDMTINKSAQPPPSLVSDNCDTKPSSRKNDKCNETPQSKPTDDKCPMPNKLRSAPPDPEETILAYRKWLRDNFPKETNELFVYVEHCLNSHFTALVKEIDNIGREKAHLKFILAKFDKDFLAYHGKAPSKNDKSALHGLYLRYKTLKKKLSFGENGDQVQVQKEAGQKDHHKQRHPCQTQLSIENYQELTGRKVDNTATAERNKTNRRASISSLPSLAPEPTTTQGTRSHVDKKQYEINHRTPEDYQHIRQRKHELQRKLFEFQNSFRLEHGHNPKTKAEKAPFAAEYTEYKV